MNIVRILSVLGSGLIVFIIIMIGNNPYSETWSHSGSMSVLKKQGYVELKDNTLIYKPNKEYISRKELKALDTYISDSTRVYILNN